MLRNMRRGSLLLLTACVSSPSLAAFDGGVDIVESWPGYANPTEALLQSTYQLVGPARQQAGAQNSGTVFFLGRISSKDPRQKRLVLVTAAHVLEDIAGDNATLTMRTFSQRKWTAVPTPIKIRDAGKPLYARHPTVDVAAMYVALPQVVAPQVVLGLEHLATDEVIEREDLTPGDEVFILGYPLGYPLAAPASATMTPGNFAVLRSGRIASYPLTPASHVNGFLIDFMVFPGNSGGPVYLWQLLRPIKRDLRGGAAHFTLIGVVSQEVNACMKPGGCPTPFDQTPLKLGVIAPATYVLETVMMLPAP